MQFKEYEETINKFAIYPEAGKSTPLALAYCALGLGGEAGEYSEKVKKLIRDGKLDKPLAAKELGDVLWYVRAAANEIGFSLEQIAQINIDKLVARRIANTLSGSGDNR